MKKRKWRRIIRSARWSLHQAEREPGTFSVRWCKVMGKYGYRVFQAPSLEMALREAPMLVGLLARPEEEKPAILLAEAFNKSLESSRRGTSARNDWHVAVRSFAKWLVENHTDVGSWQQLTRETVQEYADNLKSLSPNGRRMRLQPIQQTDRWMARRQGIPRVTEGIALSHQLKKSPACVYLADALDLLRHLHNTASPALAAGATLQALAGLRLMEAHRLTWDRVDLNRGIVEVSGEVKNAWSARVLPVCEVVTATLRTLRKTASRRSGARLEERVLSDWQGWSGYSQALSSAIQQWNSRVGWSPKDLRNVLPTWAATTGQQSALLEQYLGHAPAGVTGRHYIPRLSSVTRGESEEMEKAMALFRDRVVHPLEVAIQGHNQNRDFHLFSPKPSKRLDKVKAVNP